MAPIDRDGCGPACGAALVVALVVAGLTLGGGGAVAQELPPGADTTVIVVERDVTPRQPTVDENVTVTATVSSLANGDDRYLVTAVRLHEEPEGEGDVLAINDSAKLLRPGGTISKTVNQSFDEPGLRTLSVAIVLRTSDGRPITLTRPVTVEVQDTHPEVAVRASRVGPGGDASLNVTVANGRNESIRSVALEVDPVDFDVAEPRRIRSSLAAGGTATFTFDVLETSTGPTTVPVRLTYTAADGERRSTVRSLAVRIQPTLNPANVTLTGIDPQPDGDRVVVRGDASNVGGSAAQSVLVEVGTGDGVGPAEAGASFFVGEVPASDFSSFDVVATVETNGTVEIPLTVSFVADDTRVTRTETVVYSPPDDESDPEPEESGGIPMVGILGVILVGGAAVVWRRYR